MATTSSDEYCGHGICETFHTELHIHHCLEMHHCLERDDERLAIPGMTLTVEPMLTSGRATFHTAADGRTAVGTLDDIA